MEQGSKKAGGRPVKAIKKDVVIRLRVDKQELLVLRHKAKQAGQNLSDYIRRAAIYGTVRARVTQEQMDMIRKLVGVSTNLNQLAREFNRAAMAKTAAAVQDFGNKVDELLKFLKGDK